MPNKQTAKEEVHWPEPTTRARRRTKALGSRGWNHAAVFKQPAEELRLPYKQRGTTKGLLGVSQSEPDVRVCRYANTHKYIFHLHPQKMSTVIRKRA